MSFPRIVRQAVLLSVCLFAFSSEASAATLYSGFVSGAFTNPILISPVVDPLTGNVTVLDNTATASVSGLGTNSIAWGSFGVGGSQNTVAFTGNTFTSVEEGVPFVLGLLTYHNGSITQPTGIGGFTFAMSATLTDGNPVVLQSSISPVQTIATSNLSEAVCGLPNNQCPLNADLLSFANLGFPPPLSFNVFEEGTATAQLIGIITGQGLQLTTLQVAPGSENIAYIGNGVAQFTTPEPSTLALGGLGLAALLARRLRRPRASSR